MYTYLKSIRNHVKYTFLFTLHTRMCVCACMPVSSAKYDSQSNDLEKCIFMHFVFIFKY